MAKAESNRLNSLRSTGPKTPAGKAKVSRNAEKHGAYSEALTMLLETPEEFQALKAGLVETLTPAGPMECRLVDRLASLWWRMDRAKTVANQSLWMNARNRLKGTLLSFVEDGDPFEEAAALDRDECRLPGAWSFDTQERLLRHELTMERSFFRTLHELERLQARRQGFIVSPVPSVDLNISGAQD
jgi:hypothetical protein